MQARRSPLHVGPLVASLLLAAPPYYGLSPVPATPNRHDVRHAPSVRGPRRLSVAVVVAVGPGGWRAAGAGDARRCTPRGPGVVAARAGSRSMRREPRGGRLQSLPHRRRALPERDTTASISGPGRRTLVGGTARERGHRAPHGRGRRRARRHLRAEATAQRIQEVRAGSRTAVTVVGTAQLDSTGTGSPPRRRTGPAHRGGGECGGRPLHRRHGQLPGPRAAGGYRRALRAGRMVGHLYTVAGTGVCGSAGQGGPQRSAQLWDPVAVAVDAAGDLVVADSGDQSVLLAPVRPGTFYGSVVGAGDIGVVMGGPGATGRISPTACRPTAPRPSSTTPAASPSGQPARSSRPTASCTSSGSSRRRPAPCSAGP